MGDLLASYRKARRDGWDLRVNGSLVGEGWWREVRERMDTEEDILATSRHATTRRVDLSAPGEEVRCFLKVYRRSGHWSDVKDCLRDSKAFRALRMSLALLRDGFQTPVVLAAGESRRGFVVQSAFLLTAAVDAPTLRALAEEWHTLQGEARLERKRALLTALGAEVGRLHRMRYVAGDLLVTNVLVDPGPPTKFYFLDHDRTRRASFFESERPFRRNLVQLNRIGIPAVTNGDRYRFFVAYGQARGWDRDRVSSTAGDLARATLRRRESLARRATQRKDR